MQAQRSVPLGVATGVPVGRAKGGYGLVAKEQSMANTFAEERMDLLLSCMEGECGCNGDHDLPRHDVLRACGSGLRFKCVGVGKVITVSTFVCSGCRLDDMRATQPTTRDVRRMATEQMMLELTLKKESTARGHQSCRWRRCSRIFSTRD